MQCSDPIRWHARRVAVNLADDIDLEEGAHLRVAAQTVVLSEGLHKLRKPNATLLDHRAIVGLVEEMLPWERWESICNDRRISLQ